MRFLNIFLKPSTAALWIFVSVIHLAIHHHTRLLDSFKRCVEFWSEYVKHELQKGQRGKKIITETRQITNSKNFINYEIVNMNNCPLIKYVEVSPLLPVYSLRRLLGLIIKSIRVMD